MVASIEVEEFLMHFLKKEPKLMGAHANLQVSQETPFSEQNSTIYRIGIKQQNSSHTDTYKEESNFFLQLNKNPHVR